MCKKLLCFLTLLISLLTSLVLMAKDKDWGAYDRLLVTQRFLYALYPDLQNARGLFILRTEGLHPATKEVAGPGEIDVISCLSGSGVPGGSVPGAPPPPPPPPHCNGLYPSGPSEFLTVEVMFSTRYPIGSFSVGGSFARSKSKPAEKEIIEHPEWKEEQRIDALRRANPRFGPDQKQEFLRTVPVDAILKFTGCHLQLDTATLYAWRGDDAPPYPTIAEAAWRISGQYRRTGKRPEKCSAAFEPFDGRLIHLLGGF